MKLRVLIVGMSVLAVSSALLTHASTADLIVVDNDIGSDKADVSELSKINLDMVVCKPPIELNCISAVTEQHLQVPMCETGCVPAVNTVLPQPPGCDVFLDRIKAADRHNIRLCG